MTQANSNALQTVIDEFKNISPEIKSSFIFKRNGEIIASNEDTTEEQSKNLVAAFNNIVDQARDIGDIQSLTIQGTNNQLSIISMNNRFLSTVSSRSVDEKLVKTLTHVIVPAIVGLLDQIATEPTAIELAKTVEPESETTHEPNVTEEEIQISHDEPVPEQPTLSSEPVIPQPPVTQLMAEKIGGLLVPADMVRIDSDIIKGWSDLYGDKQIIQVHIETLEGKKTTCKFKAVKETSQSAKGIIQIPEKILQTLQTSKGKLVIVKPVVQ